MYEWNEMVTYLFINVNASYVTIKQIDIGLLTDHTTESVYNLIFGNSIS